MSYCPRGRCWVSSRETDIIFVRIWIYLDASSWTLVTICTREKISSGFFFFSSQLDFWILVYECLIAVYYDKWPSDCGMLFCLQLQGPGVSKLCLSSQSLISLLWGLCALCTQGPDLDSRPAGPSAVGEQDISPPPHSGTWEGGSPVRHRYLVKPDSFDLPFFSSLKKPTSLRAGHTPLCTI